ncbi:Repressed by EFG1 protein 1 [Colletotrichum trifolii]|uniref:Repressed by EFG1 protein 1 n=1 Tax=Colletotrichum trifolii TaxID=5466 RepID=A0A4R8RSH7_COLTR|nr:Repressed by EFG1 protein 1 [Colletotrichum trifolii]
MHLTPLLLLLLLLPVLSVLSAQTVVTVTQDAPRPTSNPEWETDDTFVNAVLNTTNTYRAQHNASDLAWNRTLAAYASAYLDTTGDDCLVAHSGSPYGENLAKGYPDATASVAAWGDERGGYSFDAAAYTEETGHFTQLVWKNTTDVGCGRKLCADDAWYIVCEYWPRGNVLGHFADEVDRPESPAARTLPGVLFALLVAGTFACGMTA